MKNNTHQSNWIVDAGLFTGFWVASLLDLTGLALHQWLGLAVGILAGYHFLTHWNWIKSVTQRWSGHTSGQARRFYLIDAGLLAGFSLILLTGLVISTWFNLTLANYAVWNSIHVTATILTLGLIVVKIGVHWRWIVKVGQRILRPDLQPANLPLTPRPVFDQVNMERRNFLKLMGVVGVAALIATYSALESDDSAEAQSTSTAQGSLSQDGSQSAASLESFEESISSGQCLARCNRGCSYPGHCRRYVDSNSNGHCDFGECQI